MRKRKNTQIKVKLLNRVMFLKIELVVEKHLDRQLANLQVIIMQW